MRGTRHAQLIIDLLYFTNGVEANEDRTHFAIYTQARAGSDLPSRLTPSNQARISVAIRLT